MLPKVLGLLRFRPVIEKLSDVNFYVAEGESVEQSYLDMVKDGFAGLSNVHILGGISERKKDVDGL